jgi:hypothetical protein
MQFKPFRLKTIREEGEDDSAGTGRLNQIGGGVWQQYLRKHRWVGKRSSPYQRLRHDVCPSLGILINGIYLRIP